MINPKIQGIFGFIIMDLACDKESGSLSFPPVTFVNTSKITKQDHEIQGLMRQLPTQFPDIQFWLRRDVNDYEQTYVIYWKCLS